MPEVGRMRRALLGVCTLAAGSFNFTRAASTRNAENLIVLRDNCPLVQAYLENWQRHREDASPIAADYWNRQP